MQLKIQKIENTSIKNLLYISTHIKELILHTESALFNMNTNISEGCYFDNMNDILITYYKSLSDLYEKYKNTQISIIELSRKLQEGK